MTAEQRASSPHRGPSDHELDRAGPATAGGREVRIGIFVLLGILSTLTVLFLLTDPATFRGRYMIFTQVDDAGGLRKGDPVQMRGVNIGRVHDFTLENRRVLITLELEGRWDVPQDSHTRIAGMGLLGGRTIEVVPGEIDSEGNISACVEGGCRSPSSFPHRIIPSVDRTGRRRPTGRGSSLTRHGAALQRHYRAVMPMTRLGPRLVA
jgi:hypothetical protein